MSLRHIEAYRAVSVSGSMTDAAAQIYTSQPQISRLISQLEEITGFLLFHRNGSRLSPTIDGLRFYREVEQTFAGLTALETAAQRIKSFSSSRLTVAAMPRLAGGTLARAVARFAHEFPEVMVTIHSSDAASVNSWVSSGLCDMGLAMLYAEPEGVSSRLICQIECVAILPTDHRLAEQPILEPQDFDGERFISFPIDSALRTRVDDIFDTNGIQTKVVAEASLGASVCALVSAGLGVSLINPLAALDEQASSGLVVRPFRPAISMDVVLLFREHQQPNRLVTTFADCVGELIKLEIEALSTRIHA